MKHKKGTKTHVKFDDGEMGLYLNVRIKDEKEWNRIYPDQAQIYLRQLNREAADSINRRLSTREAEENNTEPMDTNNGRGWSTSAYGDGVNLRRTTTWTGSAGSTSTRSSSTAT